MFDGGDHRRARIHHDACRHAALNLGTIAREAYFTFLRARPPDLVARYEGIFARGRYADRSFVADVGALVRDAVAHAHFRSGRRLPRDLSGSQLALL